MSERAQVELEYSARIEALGRKYSNSITEAAQNPLLTHTSTAGHTSSHHAGEGGKGGKTPAKANAAAASTAAKAPATPAAPNSAVLSSFHAISGLASAGASTLGVMGSTSKAPAVAAAAAATPGSPGIEDISMELDSSNHGAMVLVDPGEFSQHNAGFRVQSRSNSFPCMGIELPFRFYLLCFGRSLFYVPVLS
jgi:hypothetical protein